MEKHFSANSLNHQMLYLMYMLYLDIFALDVVFGYQPPTGC